jgi:hypothetical protein
MTRAGDVASYDCHVKPPFLGFTGTPIFEGESLDPPRQDGSHSCHNLFRAC